MYSGSEHEFEVIDIQVGRRLGHQILGGMHFISVKKHPSPDKGWLEALSNGFQTYQSLKATSAPDEDLDELAGHFVFPPRNDSGAHMRLFTGLNASQSDALSALIARRKFPSVRSPRRSCAMRTLESSCLYTRQAHPFRPANPDANNPDELQ